jgi:hypothetical protein
MWSSRPRALASQIEFDPELATFVPSRRLSRTPVWRAEHRGRWRCRPPVTRQHHHRRRFYLNIELIGLAESAFSSVLDQLGQFLPRVEHAGLHGGGGDAEDCRALLDRLLVIVNEVDDFPMFQG